MLTDLRYGKPSANGVRPVLWTKTQRAWIKKEYEAGSSLRDIAEFFGLPTHSRITVLVEGEGWLRSKKKSPTAIARNELAGNKKVYVRMYLREGNTAATLARKISKRTGIENTTTLRTLVSGQISKWGIKKHISDLNSSRFKLRSGVKRSVRTIAVKLRAPDIRNYEDYLHAIRRLASICIPRWEKIPYINGMWGNERHDSFDHCFSINAGYYLSGIPRKHYVPLKIIGHPCNLKPMPKRKNASKGIKSDFTLTELKARIKKFNSQYGNPFDLKDLVL